MNAEILDTKIVDEIAVVTLGSPKHLYFDDEMSVTMRLPEGKSRVAPYAKLSWPASRAHEPRIDHIFDLGLHPHAWFGLEHSYRIERFGEDRRIALCKHRPIARDPQGIGAVELLDEQSKPSF